MIRRLFRILFAAAVSAVAAISVQGVPSRASGALPALTWRHLQTGSVASRINEVAVPRLVENGVVHTGRIVYAAGPGGLFKTTDYGNNWFRVFNDGPTVAVGTVAVDPSNPNAVWAATGDYQACVYGAEVPGQGLYKSTDGGKHWIAAGLQNVPLIAKIVVDPTNSNVVYVAALGSYWQPTQDRGVYKTIDGGKSWLRVAFVDAWTGASDLAIDPKNPQIVYAAMWQGAERYTLRIDYGPGSRVLRSTDGGATWTRLGGGLPAGNHIGRITIGPSSANPQRLYAHVAEYDRTGRIHVPGRKPTSVTGVDGIYVSDDGGDHWVRRANAQIGEDSYQDSLTVDPSDPDTFYAVADGLQTSNDGGRTLHWGSLGLDDHFVWVDPDDSSHLIGTGDIGVAVSHDRGKTWRRFQTPFGGGLYYGVAANWDGPFYHIFGTLQDYGGDAFASRTREGSGIAPSDWQITGGGEFSPLMSVGTSPREIYWSSNDPGISRYDRLSRQAVDVDPRPRLTGGLDVDGIGFEVLAPGRRSGTVYLGSNRLRRSTDGGKSWTDLTGDLRTSVAPLDVMGTTIRLVDFDANTRYTMLIGRGMVNSISESRANPNVLWFGTKYGRVYLSRDAGRTWTFMTLSVGGEGENFALVSVVASADNPAKAYVALDREPFYGDTAPHVFATADYGAHWNEIDRTLPQRAMVSTLVEDPRRPSLLFAGTDLGVFASIDAGRTWSKAGVGIPNVRVTAMTFQEQQNDLIAATWGSGMYVLDDIAPLESWSAAAESPRPTLFAVRDAVEYIVDESGAQYYFPEDHIVTAENPPYGALIRYDVPSQAAGRGGRLEVSGADGVVSRMRADMSAGFHATSWNLSDQRQFWVSGGNSLEAHQRPTQVVPGTYRVRLVAGGWSSPWQNFAVVPDPLVMATLDDYRAHHDFLAHIGQLEKSAMQLRDRMKRLVRSAQSREKKAAYQRIADRIITSPAAGTFNVLSQLLATPKGLLPDLESVGAKCSAAVSRPTDTEKAEVAALARELAELQADAQRITRFAPAGMWRPAR